MKTTVTLALSSCCIGAALLAVEPSRAADTASSATDATDTEPCGQLMGAKASGGAEDGFILRDGEAVDFVSGGRTTHGKLLVYSDGPRFRAYWQPHGSEEKYALANAGPASVRLVSTPPQGVPASDGKPGIATRQLQVLSCPKL